jgi:hypothetical protein
MSTAYVIAVMTGLNCGGDVLCLRAVEPDATGQYTQTYPTREDCIAALGRLAAKAQREAKHQLDWRCVPRNNALPYVPPNPND